MEKTKEQKLASKQRYLAQEAKAIKMLSTNNLEEYLNALKYAYSLSIRYRKNLKSIIDSAFENPFKEALQLSPKEKCLKSGILKPWNNTYYFDKEKAESLQQYILEHSN